MYDYSRNNRVFSCEFSYPIKHVDTISFKTEDYGYNINDINILNDKIYIALRYRVFCYDLMSKKILWEKAVSDFGSPPKYFDGQHLYLTPDRESACWDEKTLDEIWRYSGDKQILQHVSENSLLVTQKTKPNRLICICKNTGDVRWFFDDFDSATSSCRVSDEVVILSTFDSFYAFDEITGKQIWYLQGEQWLDKFYKLSTFKFSSMIGPIVNGVLHIGFHGGLLVALALKTGRIKWDYMDENEQNLPGRIFYRKNKIYFTLQNSGKNNFITCLDAATGVLDYKTDKDLTSFGATNPIIVNNYFISAEENELSIYDLEKKDYVYRYKHPSKEPIFGNTMWAQDNLLICWEQSEREVYFFECQ